MLRVRDASEGWAGADLGKDGVLVLGADGFLWGRHFGKLMAGTFVWWFIGQLWPHPKGSWRRNAFCAAEEQQMCQLSVMGQLCPRLGISISLHCWSAQLREANLVGTWKSCSASFTAGHLGPALWSGRASCAPMTSSFELPSLFALLEPNQDWGLISSASGKPRQYLPQFYLQSK